MLTANKVLRPYSYSPSSTKTLSPQHNPCSIASQHHSLLSDQTPAKPHTPNPSLRMLVPAKCAPHKLSPNPTDNDVEYTQTSMPHPKNLPYATPISPTKSTPLSLHAQTPLDYKNTDI